jgi:MarR family 2-MHQ and catechol resistance regulon transcriptional repressor
MHATGRQTDTAAALADSLASFYGHAMRPSSRLIGEFERLDLSFTQFKALTAAADGEPTVKALAERLGLSLPGASRAVDQLARRGLLDRREDVDDRRCKRLSITDAGRELVHRLDDARRDALEAFAQGIDPAQRERLLAALAPVLEDLETAA